jgi:hypothetical protein
MAKHQYKWGVDKSVQDEAMNRIYEIAEEADLEVVIVSNEDFEDTAKWQVSDEGELKSLELTNEDCGNFKSNLRDFLTHDFSNASREVWHQLIESR